MNKYISPYTPSRAEIDRRYTNIRNAMQSAGLDYLIVSGSEYTGFEGAVRYMCGFHILHRCLCRRTSCGGPGSGFSPGGDLGRGPQRNLHPETGIPGALR